MAPGLNLGPSFFICFYSDFSLSGGIKRTRPPVFEIKFKIECSKNKDSDQFGVIFVFY